MMKQDSNLKEKIEDFAQENLNASNNSGFKRTLIEKGEDFFKTKTKDLEKIRQFEEKNFLKCNTKDYSRLFSHKKTNEIRPKISGSFYQNIENPISSRSDGKGLLSHNNKKYHNDLETKNINFSGKNNDLLLSINSRSGSKLKHQGSGISLLKEKLNSDSALDFQNIKTRNFTLKCEKEVSQGKDEAGNNSMLSEEFGAETHKVKEALSHRKTKSLELDIKDFDLIKKETCRSNKSDARGTNDDDYDDKNIIRKIKKNFTNGNMNNSTLGLKEKDNFNVEELKDKMNRASYLDPINLNYNASPSDERSNSSTTIEEGLSNVKPNYVNFYLFCLEQNLMNKTVFQKYFFYQLKKNILMAMADRNLISLNNNNNNKNFDENNVSTTSYEFSTNTFNISYTKILNAVREQIVNYQTIVILNDYIIFKDEVIAKYQNSILYRAKRISTEEPCVIKITEKITKYHLKYYETRNQKANNIKEEIEILRRLTCKYIVRTIEIFETPKHIYTVMEDIPKASIIQDLENTDLDTVWKYFRNLISAVEFCHEIANIVHGNIIPENLMINDQNILKLANFSQARILDEGDFISQSNIKRTQKVNPPELMSGDGYFAKAADIWFCGYCLFFMVFKKPYDPIYGIEREHITELEPNLIDLLTSLLSDGPENRYNMQQIKVKFFYQFAFLNIKTQKWITLDGEFPLPEANEETLEYVYEIISKDKNRFRINDA